MPRRPLTPCRQFGCKERVEPSIGYCDKHLWESKRYKKQYISPEAKKERNRRVKENRTDKDVAPFYSTPAWRNLRKLKLHENPLCERCQAEGRVTVATIVHHKEYIRDGGDKLPLLEQLESLCHSHHSREHV